MHAAKGIFSVNIVSTEDRISGSFVEKVQYSEGGLVLFWTYPENLQKSKKSSSWQLLIRLLDWLDRKSVV